MSIRGMYYNKFQEENPEQFNEELLYYKSKEDVLYFIDAIGEGLEIIPSIKYLGSHIENIRSIYNSAGKETEYEIEQSLLQKIIMEFKINKSDSNDEDSKKENVIKLEMYFPILIDNQFFMINGNFYTPIYQLVDSTTYRTKKFLVFKTLVMGIIIKDNKVTYEDIEGNEFNSKYLTINMFKGKVNVLIYYFAKMGYDEAMKYLGLDEMVYLINFDNDEDFVDECYNFKVSSSMGVSVVPTALSNKNNEILIMTLIEVLLSNKIKYEKLIDKEYWIKQLGKNFTKNNSAHLEKGESILVSFERTVDSITKKILRISEEDKQDIYGIVRWCMRYFVQLSKLDNMDLSNKRLRIYEPLVYPLCRKLSKGIYRLLNKKNPTYKEIRSIFNINKGYLIKVLINSEIIRYVNNVNSYDIFSVALKATQGGPQSQFNGKSDNIAYRRLHPSYMGKVDLVATSAGDPGVSFVLVPFLELKDNLHFSDEFNFDESEDNEDILYED